MHQHLTILTRRVSVGARIGIAEIGGQLDGVLTRRAEQLRDRAEHGAQAAEYAMLGGVSAAACTGLVALLKNKETLRALVDAVVGTLGDVIEGWF